IRSMLYGIVLTTYMIVCELCHIRIGAMIDRYITVYLVGKGTLSAFVYLEHGAHWAIGALAAILLISIGVHVNELITGFIGIAFIGAAFISSIMRNRREGEPEAAAEKEPTPVG